MTVFADLNSSHVHVISLFLPCHRKYSQSEYRKPVDSIVPNLPIICSTDCAGHCIFNDMVSYTCATLPHGIHACPKVCVYQENTSDLLDIPYY